MKTVRPVQVKWIDSTTDGGWNAAAGVATTCTPTHIASCGYLLEKNKERIVLGQSLSERTQEVCNLLTIPRFAILSIKRL